MPMGTSTRPVLFTLPTNENILVPLLPSVPLEVKYSAPLLIIKGILDHVSTLFIFVGLPRSPFTAGYGGLGFGSPGLPSRDLRRAVSSPQTKAPAPRCTLTVKSKPEPRIFFPRKPYAPACLIARVTFS